MTASQVATLVLFGRGGFALRACRVLSVAFFGTAYWIRDLHRTSVALESMDPQGEAVTSALSSMLWGAVALGCALGLVAAWLWRRERRRRSSFPADPFA